MKSTQSVQPSGRERRQAERQSCRLEATCDLILAGAGSSCAGRIVDISTGGIGLMVQHRIEPGTVVSVRLLGTGLRRALDMRVIHMTELARGCWLLGGTFEGHLDADELSWLRS